ncbi:uncharacterized protein RSE6_06106 [Rhynchosporium secalis]|uniref:Methyltransferase domain-containing protein n=1 Tax=Rhynchosporium secalis TaxID=38038 RepID=A0A1E1M9M6_RHYSE|nr:uncharacterized protein RSE6_06106 [Rhynchosporium secalis]
MEDSDGEPMFAFGDLDYIPFGYSGIVAPYIETGPGTMRAAATLMALEHALKDQKAATTVICDLGCGDGEFLLGLLGHINGVLNNLSTAQGVGIDYDAEFIKTAGLNSHSQGAKAKWLIYNFNDDSDDLASTLMDSHAVTHMFIYLVPKQLAMSTVRAILTRLWENGVVLCCHKFYPEYLTPARKDVLMDLMVYHKPTKSQMNE